MKRLTTEDVRIRLAQYGFILLGEYIGANSKLHLRCSCGNESYMILSTVEKGSTCKKCSHKTLSQEEVKQRVESVGMVLLGTYVNSDTPILVRCTCGDEYSAVLSSIMSGCKCIKCGYAKSSNSLRKYTFDQVKAIFELNGNKLISYTTFKQPAVFQCSCGNIESVVIEESTLRLKRTCKICKEASYSPKFWRLTKEYCQWKQAVLLRDNNTCVKCNSSSILDKSVKLHAHHIVAPTKGTFNELAYSVDNGATLCYDCHTEYHSIFGIADESAAVTFIQYLKRGNCMQDQLRELRHYYEQQAYQEIRIALSEDFINDPINFVDHFKKRPEDLTGAELREFYPHFLVQQRPIQSNHDGFKKRFLSGSLFGGIVTLEQNLATA